MKLTLSKNGYLPHLSAILLIVFSSILFWKEQYGWSVACLSLLLVLAKIDVLKTLTVSPKDGIKAEFDPKILDNIRENNEPITTKRYLTYREIEERIAKAIAKRYPAGTAVNQEYKIGDRYRADVYVQNQNSKDDLYEIKYVSTSQSAQKITNNAAHQLQQYIKELPSKPKLIVILASTEPINVSELKVSHNIQLEYFPLSPK